MAEDIKKDKVTKPDKPAKKMPEQKEKVKLTDRIKKFFREYKTELTRVVWPTKAQLIRNTTVVLVVIVFMAILIGALDLLFGFGISGLSSLGEFIRDR